MPLLEVLIIIALILLNGFFAMSELAIVSARQARLQTLAQGGSRNAQKALELAQDPSRFLSAVQIGITLIGILTGAFGGATLAEPLSAWLSGIPVLDSYSQPLAVALVVIAITYLSLILGELVPKRMALSNPEGIAVRVAGPLSAIARAARPFVTLLSFSGSVVLRLIGIRESDKATVTEEEVRTVIAEGTAAGVIDPVEHKMLEGVLRLADQPIRAIMVPRPDVTWVDLDDDPETIRNEIMQASYSRIVVVRGGNIDEPVGVVRKKDLLTACLKGSELDVAGAVLQPIYVPDGISVLRLLDVFKTQPSQMAFVVDEFGSFEGLVTPTDVLEEIAGDLASASFANASGITEREDGSYLVDGAASLDDLQHILGIKMTRDTEFHTAAGFVIHALGSIPRDGDRVQASGWDIEVVDMDGHRVDKLLFSRARGLEEIAAQQASS